MQIPKQALLLRIFIGEDDKFGGSPLYEAIVMKARELHLAGATVLRGPMGFGKSSRFFSTRILFACAAKLSRKLAAKAIGFRPGRCTMRPRLRGLVCLRL